MGQLGLKDFKLAAGFCREAGKHGGSAIYVRTDMLVKECKSISDLSVSGDFECSALECVIHNSRVYILSIYRPPGGNVELFFDNLEIILSERIDHNRDIFIAGDLNIEMVHNNNLKVRLFTLLNHFSIKAQIGGYTRITELSESCLDNIFTNSANVLSSQILEYHISDHTAQKVNFYVGKSKTKELVYKRFFSDQNKKNFIHK